MDGILAGALHGVPRLASHGDPPLASHVPLLASHGVPLLASHGVPLLACIASHAPGEGSAASLRVGGLTPLEGAGTAGGGLAPLGGGASARAPEGGGGALCFKCGGAMGGGAIGMPLASAADAFGAADLVRPTDAEGASIQAGSIAAGAGARGGGGGREVFELEAKVKAVEAELAVKTREAAALEEQLLMKIQATPQFKSLNQMLMKKNEEIKSMRQTLKDYGWKDPADL